MTLIRKRINNNMITGIYIALNIAIISTFILSVKKINRIYKNKRIEITDFFILTNKNKMIFQYLNKQGKGICKDIQVTNKNYSSYPIVFAKLLSSELKKCLIKLDTGVIYTTTTHLLKNIEKPKNINIISKKKKSFKRIIIVEAISLMGCKYVLYSLFHKENYKYLIKTFYKIKFEKVKEYEL